MKFLTNLLQPALVYYRYKTKSDPFIKFKEIIADDKSSLIHDSKSKNVLIFPLRVDPTSNTFEGILGYALKEKGFSVKAVMCGQALGVCENVNRGKNFSLHCSLCKAEQKRFSSNFGIDLVNLGTYVSAEQNKLLKDKSRKIKIADIFTCNHNGVSIGKHIRHGVSRHLLASNIDLDENENLIREFLLTAMIIVEGTRAILKESKPEFVVLSHGIYSTWGSVLEVCKTDGYPAVVWGRGYVGQGNIAAAHNESYIFEGIHEGCSDWLNHSVSESAKRELDQYFSNKKNPDSTVDHVNYYAEVGSDKGDIIEKLKLRRDSVKIGVYPNIPWDGTMFCATDDFPDMNAFVKSLVKWAVANPQVDILIRSHPAEAYRTTDLSMENFVDIFNMEVDRVPENIRIIEPTSEITSYQVAQLCDAALMYASSIALELAYDFQPVIQAGLNNASHKGFVFDAATEEDLFTLLDRVGEDDLHMTVAMRKRVVQYAYYWVKRRYMPETLMNLQHLTFQSYQFGSAEELKINNRMLDFFIDCCINKKRFIWPNEDA